MYKRLQSQVNTTSFTLRVQENKESNLNKLKFVSVFFKLFHFYHG